jgi:NAD(P)-dependent dehydrogenase (short-subunit alcohol dehydrogenase family)
MTEDCMARKTAFVTGASRGIGKAIALRLARGGYDVAVTARTVEEGERREHSSTVAKSETSAVPGSLSGTAAEIRAAGAEALMLPADLLDRASLDAAAATALEVWGRIDLVVHNGRFIGPGLKDFTLATPAEVIDKHIEANAMAPVVLNRRLLPAMIAQGGGTMIYVTSTAAFRRPFATVDKGGWGLSYAMSKAAGHAIAGVLSREYARQGIRAFNLEPGPTLTERIAQEMGGVGHEHLAWEPVEVAAEAAWWLATSPEADALNGKCVMGQELCRERNLLPGWTPKAAGAGA